MAQAMSHRGPDGEGFYFADGVALVHRRLAIIDLEAGQQPLTRCDGSAVIVFNGEIYNYQILRDELTKLGHEFRTHSDTEVILEAWKAWGVGSLTRLRGMFAFAIWDKLHGELHLARDRFGIKPMHYSWLPDGRFAFASELKSLLAIEQGLDRRLRADAIADYFALGYVPDSKCVFSSVQKLQPGCWMTVRPGRREPVAQGRYWDLAPLTNPVDARPEELLEALREKLGDSVAAHLIADVPVSAFLSGGVDSSTVVKLMASRSSERLTAFSIGFDERESDESGYAEEVARAAGVSFVREIVRLDPQADLAALFAIYDEPYADSSALPTYALCRAVAAHCKVALSGDGGDEVFLGYGWYQGQARRDRLSRLLPGPIAHAIASVARHLRHPSPFKDRRFPAAGLAMALGAGPARGFAISQCIAPGSTAADMFAPGLLAELGDYDPLQQFVDLAKGYAGDDAVGLAQYLDFKMYLPGDILTKVDRASMAHALEVRVPFLDQDVLQWTLQYSRSTLMPGGVTKGLLKQAVAPLLPAHVTSRRKQGFEIPLNTWFRGELAQRLRNHARRTLPANEILRPDYVENLIDAHVAGKVTAGSALWASLGMAEFLARRS